MGSDGTEESAGVETMSVSDVARHLSLSPTTIHRIVDDLHPIRVEGRWRLRVRDLEEWILRERRAEELPAEPVTYPGREVRLYPYLDAHNVFLDVPGTQADPIIRTALSRARIEFAERDGEDDLRGRLSRSVLEREALSSTAFHPEAAFPHPKGDERRLLGASHIVVARAAVPVDFQDTFGHRPRIVFILLARTISLQLIWEARLSYMIHRERLVPRLLSAGSHEEILAVFAATPGEGPG